jgi:hypothetical protein
MSAYLALVLLQDCSDEQSRGGKALKNPSQATPLNGQTGQPAVEGASALPTRICLEALERLRRPVLQ